MRAPVRLALVGAGAMGERHARSADAAAGVQVDVVVDRHLDRAGRIAARSGCRAADRLDDALRRCDAAVVATPADEHTETALAFLEAGRPVLVEKPLADRLDDVECLIVASERYGVPLMCGFVERFNPAVTAAATLLSAPPRRMAAQRCSPPVPRMRTGVVHDLLIHDIDLALLFAGGAPVDGVAVRTGPGGLGNAGAGAGVGAGTGCTIAFASGATASLWASRASERWIRRFALESAGHVLELDLARPSVTVSSRRLDITRTGPGADALGRQLRHFLALIHGQASAARERAGLRPPHVVAARLAAEAAAGAAAVPEAT